MCLLMPRCLIWQYEHVEGRDFGLKRDVTWDAAGKLRRSLLLYHLFFCTIAHLNVSKADPVSWCHMYSSSAFKPSRRLWSFNLRQEGKVLRGWRVKVQHNGPLSQKISGYMGRSSMTAL